MIALATILAPGKKDVKTFLQKVHKKYEGAENKAEQEGSPMKKEEKRELDWEVKDPKPPVIHSGHMENRKQNRIGD